MNCFKDVNLQTEPVVCCFDNLKVLKLTHDTEIIQRQ